jgi:hypothetical protein
MCLEHSCFKTLQGALVTVFAHPFLLGHGQSSLLGTYPKQHGEDPVRPHQPQALGAVQSPWPLL